jgi:hypothetical protein
MKHETITPNLVSDPESAAHTALALSMRSTIGLATCFAMELDSTDGQINVMIDDPFARIRCRSASHLLPPRRGSFQLCSGGTDRLIVDDRTRRCRPMRSRKSISSTHASPRR